MVGRKWSRVVGLCVLCTTTPRTTMFQQMVRERDPSTHHISLRYRYYRKQTLVKKGLRILRYALRIFDGHVRVVFVSSEKQQKIDSGSDQWRANMRIGQRVTLRPHSTEPYHQISWCFSSPGHDHAYLYTYL